MKISHRMFALILILPILSNIGGAAIPEPGLIVFGEVAGLPVSTLADASLFWANRLNTEQVIVPSPRLLFVIRRLPVTAHSSIELQS